MRNNDKEVPYEAQLGLTLYKFGLFTKTRIHEGGISRTKGDVIIPWSEIVRMYYCPVRHITKLNFVLTIDEHEDATFTVIDKQGKSIRFKTDGQDGKSVWQLYLENVQQARFTELSQHIANTNKAVVYGELAIGMDFIAKAHYSRSKKAVELRDYIGLVQIKSIYIESGKFYITYVMNGEGANVRRLVLWRQYQIFSSPICSFKSCARGNKNDRLSYAHTNP
ncbi:MAG TPA: hypothetical protein G4O18_09440 [Dehalococcoidia bacterium]|nr:hypothetical protein [Dehalococcoidia bacterium]